ncbi:hypothetical protein ACFRFU_49775, partial [Streptomyces sp. NPDC056704]
MVTPPGTFEHTYGPAGRVSTVGGTQHTGTSHVQNDGPVQDGGLQELSVEETPADGGGEVDRLAARFAALRSGQDVLGAGRPDDGDPDGAAVDAELEALRPTRGGSSGLVEGTPDIDDPGAAADREIGQEEDTPLPPPLALSGLDAFRTAVQEHLATADSTHDNTSDDSDTAVGDGQSSAKPVAANPVSEDVGDTSALTPNAPLDTEHPDAAASVADLVAQLQTLRDQNDGNTTTVDLPVDDGTRTDWYAPLPDTRESLLAQSLIDFPLAVERPLAAHLQLARELARVLRDPDTATRVKDSGVRVRVVPRSAASAEDPSTPDDVPQEAESVGQDAMAAAGDVLTAPQEQHATHVLVAERHLLDDDGHAPDRERPDAPAVHATVTNQLARMIHRFGLTDDDRALVRTALGARTDIDDAGAKQADARAEDEFAYITDVYLGVTPHDDTAPAGDEHKSGAEWVRAHQPGLLPLLTRLYDIPNVHDVHDVPPTTPGETVTEDTDTVAEDTGKTAGKTRKAAGKQRAEETVAPANAGLWSDARLDPLSPAGTFTGALLAEPELRDLPAWRVRLAILTLHTLRPAEVLVGDRGEQQQREELRDDLRRIVLAALDKERAVRALDPQSELPADVVEEVVRAEMLRTAREVVEAREAAIGVTTGTEADRSRYLELTDPDSPFRKDLKVWVDARLRAQAAPDERPPKASYDQITRAWQRLPELQRKLPLSQLSAPVATAVRSNVRAVADASGAGIEGEFTEIVKLAPEFGSKRKNVRHTLARGHGYRVVVEEKEFYLGPNGEYYRRREDALKAGGKKSKWLFIPEFVSDIVQVLGHEAADRRGKGPVFAALKRLEERLGRVSGQPGGRPTVPLEEILSPQDGWEIAPTGVGARIGQRAINDWPGFHVHYTFGVPITGMYDFLAHVRDNTWRDAGKGYLTKDHLSDGLEFGTELAARFVLWSEHGQGRMPAYRLSLSDIVAKVASDLSVAALRGYAALFYDNLAALAQGWVYEELYKANAAVLSRNAMADIRDALPGDVQQFLEAHTTHILRAMEERFRRRIPNFDSEYRRILGATPPATIYDLSGGDVLSSGTVGEYAQGGLIRGYPHSMSQEHAFATVDLDGLDRDAGNHQIPLVVVEVRSYGARHVSTAQAKKYYDTLEKEVLRLHARAESYESSWQSLRSFAEPDTRRRPVAAAVQTALLAAWHVETLVRQSSSLGPGQVVEFSHVAAIVPALNILDTPGGKSADSEVRAAIRGISNGLRDVSQRNSALIQAVMEAMHTLKTARDALDSLTTPQNQQAPRQSRPSGNPSLGPLSWVPVSRETLMSGPRAASTPPVPRQSPPAPPNAQASALSALRNLRLNTSTPPPRSLSAVPPTLRNAPPLPPNAPSVQRSAPRHAPPPPPDAMSPVASALNALRNNPQRSAPRHAPPPPPGSRHGASRGHQGDPGPQGRGGFFAGAQESLSPEVVEAGPVAGPSAPRVSPTERPVTVGMSTELSDGTRAASRPLPESPHLVELSVLERAAMRYWPQRGVSGLERLLRASGPGAHSLVVTEPQGTGYGSYASSLVAVNLGDRAGVRWLDRSSGVPVSAPDDTTQVWSLDLDARSVLLNPPAQLAELGPAAIAFPALRLPVTVLGLLDTDTGTGTSTGTGTGSGSGSGGRNGSRLVEPRPLSADWAAVLEEDANGFVPDPTNTPTHNSPKTRAEAWHRVLASYERYAETRAALRDAAPYEQTLPAEGTTPLLDPVVAERAAAQLRLEMDAKVLREWGHTDPVALILQHEARQALTNDTPGGKARAVRFDLPESVAADGSATAPVTEARAAAAPVPPDSQAPVGLPAMSSFVRTYGSQRNGTAGMVYLEPIPPEMVDAVHEQVLEALSLGPVSTATAERERVREQLRKELNGTKLALALPYLHSDMGHRISVRTGGRDVPVDVRLTIQDPRYALRYAAPGGAEPDVRLEGRSFGTQESSSAESSGTSRTLLVPWTGSFPITAIKGISALETAVSPSVTHNQLTQSSGVTQLVRITTSQRSTERATPYEFTAFVEVRANAPRQALPVTWGPAREHGVLTFWFPEHLALDGPSDEPLPPAADLDDLPVWSAETVAQPALLLEEVQDRFAGELRGISDDSLAGLHTFLSEPVVRGTVPMQRTGGIYSPVLLDGRGRALGMFKLTADVTPGQPIRKSVDGKNSLEAWLSNTVRIEGQARITSGVGVTGSVGPVLSGLRTNPVNLANTGSLLGRGGGQWQTSDTFVGGGTAAIIHSARTKRSHLLIPADVTYTVTLIRPDGSEVRPPADNPLSPRPSGMHLRLLAREDARGHVPTQNEVRTLPPELESLRTIGLTATPIAVQGTEALFQHAEDWLRENGFLPPPPHRPSRNRIVPDEALVQARLNNLRRFEQARSEIGLRAATDSMVDGGHPIYLEKPTTTGIHRVQLRLTATRTPGPDHPSRHTSTLPHINSVSNATFSIPGAEQKSQAYGGSLGLSAGPRGTVRNGSWTLSGGGEYLWSGQVSDTQTVSAGLGHDQFFISSASGGSQLFEIPAELALDLYDGPGTEPTVRFAHRTVRAPYTPYGQNPPTARQPLPDTVSGTIVVLVPHHRTLPHDAPPAEPAPYVIRAVNTTKTDDNDYIRLGMTDDLGQPLPDITQLPDDALVDTFQASTALQEAIRQLLTNTYPGHPAQGNSGSVRTFMADHVPDLVNTAARRIGETLAGQASTDPTTVASEVLTAAVSPGALLVRAHQILKGAYVIEGLTLPGLASDGQFSVEIRGYLHHPEYRGSIEQYMESGLSSVDTASQQRASARMHQGAASFTATQSAPVAHPIPADAGAGNDQETNPIRPRSEPRASDSGSAAAKGKRPLATVPSARYTSTVSHEESAAVTTMTVVERTATNGDMEHRVRSGATLLVTLYHGRRSLAVNALGLGAPEPRTVAVDLPRSVEFLMTYGQLNRYGKWYEDVPGLAPEKPAPAPGIPLPRRFTISKEPGLASIMSVIQYDDPNGNGFHTEWRNRLGDELVTLVEKEAPGVLTPGHASYLPGVAARIADYTSTPGLRALVSRGPNGDLKLHFQHLGYGGARLVTITLSARPAGDTNALRTERGRPAGPDSGIEHFHLHQPAGITNATSDNRQQTGSINVTLRIPRTGSDKLTDRFGGLGTALSTRTHTARDIKNVEDRYWLRTDNVVDFDLLYEITATLSVTRVTDWPPNILGAFVQEGVISAMETNADVRTWLQRTVQGRPVSRLSVPAFVGLRFAGSEAVEPDTSSTPLDPRVTDEMPRMAGQVILPIGPVTVLDYNAAAELANALDTVAPSQARSWRALTASASGESTAVRLGELIQAGEISLDWPRTTNGLTTSMPGAYPFESEPGTQPVMAISLHNPRPVTMGGDVTLDRVRHNTDFAGSSVGSGSTAGFSIQGLGSLSDTNRQILGVSLPFFGRQPTFNSNGGTVSGGRRNWKKIGSTSEPSTGLPTRSYETLFDAKVTVRGPEGILYAIGTISGRIGERDALGFGITPPRTDPGVYDLQSMVKAAADAEAREAAAADAAQDEGPRPAGEETPVTADAALRDWNRRPLRDLPDVLISQLDPSDQNVELWLAVDDDQRQVGRAVFTAAQTAARHGRPVTLVLRAEDRLRTWEFDGDGEPTGLDAAAATAWRDFSAQAAAFTTAAAAETDARGREIALEPRLRTAREHLDEITPLVDPAATALATARERGGLAEGDLSTARQTRDQLRQSAQDLSDQVTRLVREGAVLDDEINKTRGGIGPARIAVRQKDSVVEDINRRRAAAPVEPDADARTDAPGAPRPDEDRAREARENLDALQTRLADQQRRSQELVGQVDTARQEAEQAQTGLGEAEQAVAQAEKALREARKEAVEAEERHGKAVADRDAAQREVTAREEDIREARAEQTRRTTAQTAAEQRFPDLVALVEQARTLAGQDPAGIPRGSAATTPARWPVHGRRPAPPRGVPTNPAPERTSRQPADPPTVDPANPLAVPPSSPPAAPPSARHDTGDGTPERETGTPEQETGTAEWESAGAPSDATLSLDHPGTSYGVTPDSFAAALARALRSGGVRGEGVADRTGWTAADDVHHALRAWARQELTLQDAPVGVRLPAGDDPVAVGELERVGVQLTPAQHAQAVLRAGVLPAAEAQLTREQQTELLLGDTGSPAYADTMAALVARALGQDVVISGPGTESRTFGPETGAGAPLRLHFDGATYSVITGSGEVSTERWRPLTDGSGPEPFVLSEEDGRRRWVSPDGSGERTLVGYAWTWHEGVEGRPPVVVMTRRLFLSAAEGAGEAELERVRQLVPQALDELVNARGYRLPVWPDRLRAQWDEESRDPAEAERDTQTGQPVSERPLRFQSQQDMVDGPLLRLRVEFVDDPDMAHEEPIKVRPRERGVGQVMDQGVWFAGEDNPVAYVHEILHGFGVADDLRTDGETRPGTSLMGHRWGSDLALTTEHLRQIAEVYAPSAHPTSHSAPELTWHGPMKRKPADVAPAVDYNLIHPYDMPSPDNPDHKVVESREDETLWRISDVPPEQVFARGFFANDVERMAAVTEHVGVGHDQFISTTRSSVLGHIIGTDYKRWRYEIHPWLNFDKTGVDVNATLASQNDLNGGFTDEQEVAFTRRIDPAAIARVRDRETGATGVWDATRQMVVWSAPPDEIVVLFDQGDKELAQAANVAIGDLALRLVTVARRNPGIAHTAVYVKGFGNGSLVGSSKARKTGLERAKAVKKFLAERIKEELETAKEIESVNGFQPVRVWMDSKPDNFVVFVASGASTVDPVLNHVVGTKSERLRSAVIRFEHKYFDGWGPSGRVGPGSGALAEPPAVGVVEPGVVAAPGLGVDWFTPLPESDAVDVASELIVVPEAVGRPVAARMQLTRLVSGMLTDPDTADRVRESGVRVVVIPRDVRVTDLVDAADLTHAAHETPDGVSDTHVTGRPRGLTLPQAKLVLVSEENLLGEHTTTDPSRPFQADGYSSVTHELAHMIYHFGLTDQDRQTVRNAFTTKTETGDRAEWADGPLTGPDGTTRNYSSRNAEEYFAQTVNAYLGTNHGNDPYTTQPRNNGAAWVRDNEPDLLPLLEHLHTTNPTPIPHPNPLALTTAENTHWQGYRDFTALTALTGPTPTLSPADGNASTTARPAHEDTSAEEVVNEVAVGALAAVELGRVTGSGEVSTERWRPLTDRSGPEPFVLSEENGRRTWVTPESSSEWTQVGYAWTWHEGMEGRPPVVVMTRRLFLSAAEGAGEAELERVRQLLPEALDAYVNARGYRLPVWPDRLRAQWDEESRDPAEVERDTQTGEPVPERPLRFQSQQDMVDGPLLRLRVKFVDDRRMAHDVVEVRPGVRKQGMDQEGWFAGEGQNPVYYVHEVLHGFGVADDLETGGDGRPRTSLMGDTPGPDLALTAEHVRQIAEVYAPSAHPTSHSAPELTWHGPVERNLAHVRPALSLSLLHPDDRHKVVESRVGERLWRFSDVPPERVFVTGFAAPDAQDIVPLIDYVEDPFGQFVSTTRDADLWYENRRYRYEIHSWRNSDPTGVDVNASLKLQGHTDSFDHEREVVFLGRIDQKAIVRVLDRETGLTGVWDATRREMVWLPLDGTVVLFDQGEKKLPQRAMATVGDVAVRLVAVATAGRASGLQRTVVYVKGFGNGGRLGGSSQATRTGQARADAVKEFLTQRITEELAKGANGVTPEDFVVFADSGGSTGDPALNGVVGTSSERLRSAVLSFQYQYSSGTRPSAAAKTGFGAFGEPPAVGVVEPGVAAPGLGVDWFTPLPESDAVDVATELIVVPEAVGRPVAARMQLTRLVSGMLTDPNTARQVRESGVRVVVIPRGVRVTDLVDAADLTHAAHETPDGVSDTHVTGRGLTLPQAKLVLVSEENLLGEHTTTDQDQPHQPFQADGYSSVTHELAHMIYHFGLTYQERQTVREAFTTKTETDDGTQWADGPLTGPDGTTRNYSSRNPEEYFAQTTNTYLGTNHGTDPFTTRPRNNGAAWVRDNEPVLLPILERLHGTDPAPVPHPNPVALTTAENTHWQGYRDFTTLTGPRTAPTPSPADGNTRTTPARATDRPAHEETPSPAAGPAVSDRAVATALASYAAALTTLEHARTTHHTAKQRDINHGEGSSTHVTDPTGTHTALTRAHAAVTHAETVLNSLGVNLEDLRINDDDLRTRPRLPGGSHYTFKEATDNPHDDTDSDADAGDAFDPLFDDAEIDDTDSDAPVDNRGEAGTGRLVPASRPGLALPASITSGPVAPVRPGPSPLTRSGPPNTAADRGTEGTDQTTPASEEPAIAAIQASIDTYRNGPWLNLTPAQGPVLWGDVEHPDPHPSWAAPNEGRTLTPRQRVTLFTALVRLNTPAPLDAVHQHITATHHLTLTSAALHHLHHQYLHWRENDYRLRGEIDGWSYIDILTAYTQYQQATGGAKPRPPKKLTWPLNGRDLPLGQIMRKIHTETPRDENRRHLINHLRKQGATHLSLPLRAEFSDEDFLGAITQFKNETKWDGGKLNQGQTQLFNGKIIPIGRLLYNYRNRIAMVSPTLLQGMNGIGIQNLDRVRMTSERASPQIIADEEFLGGLMAHKNETKWDGGKLNQRQTQLFNGKIIPIGRLYYIRNGKVMASAALLRGMKEIGIQDLDRARIKPERASRRKITDEEFLGGLMAHKNETKWDGGKLNQGQTQLFNGKIIPIAEHLYNIQHGRTMAPPTLLQGMKEIGIQNLDKVRIKTGKDYRQNIADSLGIIAATAPTTKPKGGKRSAADGPTGRSGPRPAKRPKGTGAGTSTAASAGVVPVPSAEVRSPAPAPRPSDGTLPSTRTVGPDVLREAPDAPGSSAHPGTESTGPTLWDDILGGATFSSHPNMDLTGANDPSSIPDWTGLPLPGTESTGPTLWDDILGGATFSSHPNMDLTGAND